MRTRSLIRSSSVDKGMKTDCGFTACPHMVHAYSTFYPLSLTQNSFLAILCRKIAPTILLDVPQDSQIMKEEIFGPLLPILTVRTETFFSKTIYYCNKFPQRGGPGNCLYMCLVQNKCNSILQMMWAWRKILKTHSIFSLPLQQVEKIEEAFDVIKSKSKPLAAYLFSENKQLQEDFVNNISSGGMIINDAILHVMTILPLKHSWFILHIF